MNSIFDPETLNRFQIFIDEKEILRINPSVGQPIRGNWGTAFVKHRGQLSPKYLKLYKEKEKKKQALEKSMLSQQQSPLGQFKAQVSGFNWTIPTIWMANRFKSTYSSAFMLSNQDDKSEIDSKKRKRSQGMRKRRLKK